MKPSAFDYIRVDTLDEALSVLADNDLEAKVLAGGQSLLPMLNMRLAQPKALIDINRLAALATLGRVETNLAGVQSPATTLLEVGALVRQRQLERYALEEPRAKLILTALTYVGHPQTRNQGTVGGSLAHADPSAELPLLFLTLGGTAIIQSTRGERQVAAEEFFQSYFTTAIEPGEMLTKTLWRLPAPEEGIAFKEYRRRHGDFALLAAACTMKIGSDRTVKHVRLGLGGVTDTPLLVDEVREVVGEHWAKELVRMVAKAVVNRLDCADDYQASSSYRRQLASVLIASVLDAAYEDALAKEGNHGVDQG
jgi:carbon-monoxide dehydrogenase medium subunit/2-furoyl-CoA dehydrogenase FAD binding subunit